MNAIKWAALTIVLVLASGVALGQNEGQNVGRHAGQNGALTPFDKLPDWTGTWTMIGDTVFDQATRVGKGNAWHAGRARASAV